jgi:hypothetical protein
MNLPLQLLQMDLQQQLARGTAGKGHRLLQASRPTQVAKS